jgi:exosome complex RNA-binding protein Rrp4
MRWRWLGSRRHHLRRFLEAGELVVAKLVELQEAAEVVVEAAAFA